MSGNGRLWQFLPAILASCLGFVVGCDVKGSSNATAPKQLVSPPEPVDQKAFTNAQYERVRAGLASINVGQMLIERTHPTGSFISSRPPTMILSADRREIIAKVTGRWAGGITKAEYETSFTIEITKNRTRLTVERDTAVLQIHPNQLKFAELDVINIVQPLL